MRGLTPLSRRRFGQGLGASLALASAPHGAAAHDGPHVVTVRMSRFAFVPAGLEIRPGDTVVWINEDLAPHTATARDGSWDTGTLETGVSARIAFATPGDFEYFCAFHPHMTGTVSVRSLSGG
jgi:plastocyanin